MKRKVCYPVNDVNQCVKQAAQLAQRIQKVHPARPGPLPRLSLAGRGPDHRLAGLCHLAWPVSITLHITFGHSPIRS